jgi:SAM-dependent methyltransferase
MGLGEHMEYDPLKNRLAKWIELFPILRIGMYKCLDVMLLRQRYVQREIKAVLKKRDAIRLYDAGAGFCQYSHFVLQHWQNSIAFASDLKTDYLQAYAIFTESRFPNRFSFRGADLQHFAPKTLYNLALAIDILEHIPNDLAALQNFYKALSPNGYLIISTPSDSDEAAKYTEEHVRPGYNKTELETKLKENGFRIVKSTWTYGWFGHLAWLLAMKYPTKIAKKGLLLLIPYYLAILPFAEILMHLDMMVPKSKGTGILIVAQKA